MTFFLVKTSWEHDDHTKVSLCQPWKREKQISDGEILQGSIICEGYRAPSDARIYLMEIWPDAWLSNFDKSPRRCHSIYHGQLGKTEA